MCDEKRRSVCISLCEGPNMARVWQSSKKNNNVRWCKLPTTRVWTHCSGRAWQ